MVTLGELMAKPVDAPVTLNVSEPSLRVSSSTVRVKEPEPEACPAGMTTVNVSPVLLVE